MICLSMSFNQSVWSMIRIPWSYWGAFHCSPMDRVGGHEYQKGYDLYFTWTWSFLVLHNFWLSWYLYLINFWSPQAEVFFQPSPEVFYDGMPNIHSPDYKWKYSACICVNQSIFTNLSVSMYPLVTHAIVTCNCTPACELKCLAEWHLSCQKKNNNDASNEQSTRTVKICALL